MGEIPQDWHFLRKDRAFHISGKKPEFKLGEKQYWFQVLRNGKVIISVHSLHETMSDLPEKGKGRERGQKTHSNVHPSVHVFDLVGNPLI